MSEEGHIPPTQRAAQSRWLDAYRALDLTLPRPLPTSKDTPQVRDQLDAEVLELQDVLCIVKERRNELALPSMLPPEIMAYIFSILVAVDSMVLEKPLLMFETGSKPTKSLGWVSVSHVCRRWRNICLNQSSLWTHLCTDGRQPWDVFLERSKVASLVIEGCSQFNHGTTILEHRHRIRKLTLSNMQPLYALQFVSGLVGPLYRLEVLSLACSPTDTTILPSLPSGFLSTMAPNLRDLRLVGVLFPWGEGSRFATHLRQTPSLKMLELVNALPDHSLEANAGAIALPHIEVLDIVNDSDSCWRLWSLLRIPSTASISIHGKRALAPALEQSVVTSLREQLRTSPLIHYRNLIVDIPVQGSLRFSVSDPRGPESAWKIHVPKGGEDRGIALRLSCDDAAKMARRLLAEVHLKDVENLVYKGGEDFGDSQVFYDTFRSASGVTTLRLMGDGAGHCVMALRPSFALSPPETTLEPVVDYVLFPKLDALACSVINFDENIYVPGLPMNVHIALGRAFIERSELFGKKLKTLDIDSCDVLDEWVDEWRELVDQVDWDGDEGELAQPDDEQSDYGYGGPYDEFEFDGPYIDSDFDDPWDMGMF
ncbi:unnamed protein product [Peniophora sp. CBMAI 1063]|nr:unnamed protein product [Peniophora sp. CBMAI 1063]